MKYPDFYPPSPRDVPRKLTKVSAPFRRQVNLVALSLLLFFVLYFGLIGLLLAGITLCLFSKYVGLYILAGFLAIPVVILVKNLFNRQKFRKGYEIEIDLADHPKLEAFVQCVCDETGAPMPDRVLLSFEVNAYAGSEVSLASLFVQPRRTLMLGLGLINVINLTEFKALLAHEFGHLSQMNMKSAPYVRLAVQVVDNILSNTKLFGLDRLMQAMFVVVYRLNLALSREMEFHADLVAVSVAGSDAVPHLLYKSYWGEACLQRAAMDLDAAQDHGLYSRDVFLHQAEAGKFLRKGLKNKTLGEPPRLPADPHSTLQLFRPDEDEDHVAKMWATHPPNHEREINAKAFYVRSEFDETSPWTLFSNRVELREKASYLFYRHEFRLRKKEVKWSSGDKVQDFLDEEYAETTFDVGRYGLLYNSRVLEKLDVFELRERCEANLNAPEELLTSHAGMYTPAVKKFGEVYLRHLEEADLLLAAKKRWYRPKKKRFEMRGRKIHVRDAADLLKDIEKEIKEDARWLKEFDTKVFVTYFELACHLRRDWAEELYQRYRFHYVIDGMWKSLQEHKSAMNFMFEYLSRCEGGILDANDFHVIIEVFRQAYDACAEVLERSGEVTFPQLANLPADKPVRPFLMEGYLSDKPTHFDFRIKFKWLVKFANQFQSIEKRVARLHFKSLGNILTLQESIGVLAEKTWLIVAQISE